MKLVDGTIVSICLIAAAHNVVAAGRRQQLISERVDDYRTGHQWLTDGVIVLLALHLTRRIPCKVDAFWLLGETAKHFGELVRAPRRHVARPM